MNLSSAGGVAKRKDGKYHIGKRTRDWLKIKAMQDEDLPICGYQSVEEGKVKDVAEPRTYRNGAFMHETQSGGMRQPVWKGIMEDK